MTEEEKNTQFNESAMFPWLQMVTDMWMNAAKSMPSDSQTAFNTQTAMQNRFTQQLDTNLNLLKSFTKMMEQPESESAAANAIKSLPEIFLKMTKTGFDAAMQIQTHLMEKAGSIGKRTEAYNFENLDQEIFKAWGEIYEKDIQPYFKIPPLGLTRFYQEHFNEFLNRHNIFQTTLAEFLSILYLPMEKSFKVFQERLQQMAEEGNIPTSSKENYAMWLKILEGHYMTLFKSPDYTQALHRVLKHFENFMVVKNETMQDYLQMLPVVTHKDIDDLYKEFYVLKKRVRELEKMLGVSPNAMDARK
ncbi:MAG: poly(R)-hydroxyalkanoic acid synthase subunit PhaE [Smithella sp.]